MEKKRWLDGAPLTVAYFANQTNKKVLMDMQGTLSQRIQRRKNIEAQAKIFKALGHPSRLLMAEALSHGSLCVNELQQLVGADMSTVSRHLAVLKGADIVSDEKKGQNVYYTLKLTCLGLFLNGTSAALDKQAQARQAQLAAMMTP